MSLVPLHAEVLRLLQLAAGDAIPPGPATADVVERGKHASNGIGLGIAGGACCSQANVLRVAGQRRQ